MSDLLFAAQSFALQIEFLGLGAAICAVGLAWLIIWILVAVWVYRDAESRGASGILWLIVVILLGLIGLIIYLIVRPSGPRPAYAGYPGYAGYPPPQYAPPGYAPQPPAQPVQPPMQSPAAAGTNCPRCGQPLQYVQQYQRWYCPAEKVYPWG